MFLKIEDCIVSIYTEKTLAHIMAERGYFFDPDRHRHILALRDFWGKSVAHVMAERGYPFDPERHRDILYIADDRGITVAHVMAKGGFSFDPDRHREVLLLTDLEGNSVAHTKAKRGFVFDPLRHKSICHLENSEGERVIDIFLERNAEKIISGELDDEFLGLSVDSLREYIRLAETLFLKKQSPKTFYAWKHLESLLPRRMHLEMQSIIAEIGVWI